MPPLDGSSITSSKKNQDPNIDFELDVKVLIKSGKCVLHTKDSMKDEEAKMYYFITFVIYLKFLLY